MLSAPMWPLLVDALGDDWADDTEASTPARRVVLGRDDQGVTVTAEAVGGRLDCAWSLTLALTGLYADPAFEGVPATIRVDGLTVAVPAEVMAATTALPDRGVWRAGVTVVVG